MVAIPGVSLLNFTVCTQLSRSEVYFVLGSTASNISCYPETLKLGMVCPFMMKAEPVDFQVMR